ncbi:serine/threonine protein kinase [Desertifilum sp. FACHB-1129]|uniref:Protein kinase domain-containing protein n=1 Tax=Desertifilum tharense IPPAS B-1220 TaxID=1781255 RepID=A0A1E5QI33_9CYAN|nr:MULTISPECIES: serine/threonine-protein kinase [Desertifilum]MDA0211363.1 serine/threonine-protein kinase [Cyanobacteria bacterium FC1]MBD2313998.1 serine/threonine protein kinase [Desertifilum sp. FACHB-1129]MBD2320324.1 serine/threonine protein kinase [Desertifilum sp. FACHB-866]MBD2330452.1 serine/threonine protein kinase [Desertifilum sp. FACHB-868]OEJ74237.1 hypothetical protein BH720_15655 [Desertifilum tharense IPPAS B-1220]
MDLIAGTVLQEGKYIIAEVLGQGGFGTTYRATHTYLGQSVVLKTLNENLRQHANFDKFQQQFVAEAQRLAKCAHPNIVKVLDFFEESGLSFIVMEYIPGQTLAELIKSGQPLPEVKAVHYLRQVAEALSVVHQNGLLHRDVKPQNIMRRHGSDFVVLIDFGIAREFTPDTTQTHTGLLSEGYAPIEQYLPQGKRSPATDIYALAATLYCLLTGRAPIAAPLRDRIPLVAPRQLQPSLSLAVESATLAGLEMEAGDRPQTVEEWLALLPTPVLSETGNTGRPQLEVTQTGVTLPLIHSPSRPSVSSRPSAPVAQPAPVAAPPPERQAIPVLWIAIGSAIAIAAGATGFWLVRHAFISPAPEPIPDQSFPNRPIPSDAPIPEVNDLNRPRTAPVAPPPAANPEPYEPSYAPPDSPPADEVIPETPIEPEYPVEDYEEPYYPPADVIPEPEPAPEPAPTPLPEATTPPIQTAPEPVLSPFPDPLPPAADTIVPNTP